MTNCRLRSDVILEHFHFVSWSVAILIDNNAATLKCHANRIGHVIPPKPYYCDTG